VPGQGAKSVPARHGAAATALLVADAASGARMLAPSAGPRAWIHAGPQVRVQDLAQDAPRLVRVHGHKGARPGEGARPQGCRAW
jgi:hypothetical protein